MRPDRKDQGLPAATRRPDQVSPAADSPQMVAWSEADRAERSPLRAQGPNPGSRVKRLALGSIRGSQHLS